MPHLSRYQALLAAGFEGMCIHRDGVILEVNDSLAQIYGYSREEMVGMRMTNLVAPEWLDRVVAVVEAGYEDAYDTMALSATGERIPLRARAKSISWDGQPARVAAFLDLREKLESERALEFSESRLNEAQRVAEIGSFHASRDREWFSLEARRLLALPEGEEPSIATMIERVCASDRARVRDGFDAAWAKGNAFQLDTTIDRGDGEVLDVAFTLQAIHGDDGVEALSGTVQNIALRKRLEAQLLHAQKMEGLGRLAGGIAHDINNSLVGVISFIDFAQEKLPRTSEIAEDLDLALDAANQAARVVKQIASFTRPDSPRSAVIDVNRDLGDVSLMLMRLLGDHVALKLELDSNLWPAWLGEGHVAQIVTNMVLNASDAMRSGGTISLTTRNAPAGTAPQRARPEQQGDFVVLAVGEDGPGIPANDLDRVFEPFFTTKLADGGTGLGLSMCYALVEKAGGFIEVESEVGVGTTFVVYLPRAAGEHVPAPRSGRQRKNGTEGLLLLVDDDPIVRVATKRMIEGMGYEVVVATSGLEAVDLFRERRGEIQAVIGDVIMPGMTGTELAQTLRTMAEDLPIVFISGHSSDHCDRESMVQLKSAFVAKPFSAKELREAIELAIRRARLSATS